MKLAFKTVEPFLVKPDAQARAVLIYGPDAGLVRERAGRIKTAILGGGDDPFALVEMDESKILADPALLADELGAFSLMGGKRLIWIRDGGDKLTRHVEEMLSRFHDQVFLMITADELSSRSSLRALFDKEPILASLACYKDEVRDVQSVIRKKFDEAGLSAGSDVMDYLASQLGNDRYVTYQELEKIILFAGATKRISLEEAEALVDYNRDTGLDDIVAALADKNLDALEHTLTIQRHEGISPVAYTRAAMRYFNRLYYIRSKMASGESADEVIRGLRPPVFFKLVPTLTRHVHSWDIPQIVKALKLLLEAELACKTSDLPAAPSSHRKFMQITQIRA